VHIIYFRCTEHPAKLMVPALLTRFKKRTYPDYAFNRDPEIWTSRHHLLDYEKALELEALVDETLEAEVVSSAKIAAGSVSAPVAASSRSPTNRFVTPAVATSISARTPSKTNRTPKMSSLTDRPRLNETPKGETPDDDFIPDVGEEVNETPLESVNVKKAKVVAKCLDDWLLHNWEVHLELKCHAGRPPSLQRFECGA
jgi:Fanconi-associated nuclease 1